MTIQIQVKNDDKVRDIEVIEVTIDKKTGARKEGPAYRVAPGCSTTATIYMLRDVLVREIDPVNG